MSSFIVALVLATFCVLPEQVNAASFLRAGHVTEKDANDILLSEFEGRVGAERLDDFRQKLRLTFTSLPKNAFGNLGHQAVRYVLHRFFVQQHGWYVRGLEPDSRKEQSPTGVAEWVPSYLQTQLERRLGDKGANLHDLAVLAASLEDVVRKEAIGRLETAYSVHETMTDESVGVQTLKEIMQTYYVAYLLQGNLTISDLDEADRKEAIFAKKYAGWTEAAEWLDNLESEMLNSASTASVDPMFDFATASDVATEIGAKFYSFNDFDCSSLKSTLVEMEGKRAGRVRLSTFYKKSLHSHWQFSEKADYLRVLGALDESDPTQPSIIVPNYLMARTNCLEASNLYAVCCRNECEDLMGHLEEQIGMEKADPARILELVANLPSGTVSVPRSLPEGLVARLQQVADFHQGSVPLHSRLFAQWMHHAYPRECPYPHEAGTTSPQTPDEWMQETGQEESTLSEDEIKKHVESDTCAIDSPHNCDEDSELPWSHTEEILGITHYSGRPSSDQQFEEPMEEEAPVLFGSTSQKAAALMAIGLAALLVWDHLISTGQLSATGIAKKLDDDNMLATKPPSIWRILATFFSAALTAHAFGFLQATTFALALAFGLAGVLVHRIVGSRKPAPSKCLPF